jgi:hypothetical protein
MQCFSTSIGIVFHNRDETRQIGDSPFSGDCPIARRGQNRMLRFKTRTTSLRQRRELPSHRTNATSTICLLRVHVARRKRGVQCFPGVVNRSAPKWAPDLAAFGKDRTRERRGITNNRRLSHWNVKNSLRSPCTARPSPFAGVGGRLVPSGTFAITSGPHRVPGTGGQTCQLPFEVIDEHSSSRPASAAARTAQLRKSHPDPP